MRKYLLTLTVLLLGAATQAMAFSVHDLKGNYVYTDSGTNSVAPQFVDLSSFHADGHGNFEGEERNLAFEPPLGVECDFHVAGTYAVDQDGTTRIKATYTAKTAGCGSTYTQTIQGLMVSPCLVRFVADGGGILSGQLECQHDGSNESCDRDRHDH